MIKRYTTIAIAAVAWVGFMLAVSPRSQWPMTAVIAVAAIALFAALMTPAVRRVAQTRKWLFVLAGVAALVVGAGVLAAGLAFPSAISVDLSAYGFCALLLLGLFLIGLPRLAAASERAMQAQKTVQAAGPPGAGHANAISEATEALSDPISQLTSFAQVIGPWFAAFCALPLALWTLNKTYESSAPNGAPATAAVLALLGLILAGFLILIIAGIQWTRFVATGRKPGWASIPGRALWGWVWRLMVYGSIVRATQGIEPWLDRRLPATPPWVLHGLADAAVWAAAVLTTPFALSLTAAALGATARAAEMRIRVFRTAGRKLYIGAAAVLAPFFLITWLSDAFSDQLTPTAQMAAGYVYLVALFLTVTGFAGYLGRLYAKAAGDAVG